MSDDITGYEPDVPEERPVMVINHSDGNTTTFDPRVLSYKDYETVYEIVTNFAYSESNLGSPTTVDFVPSAGYNPASIAAGAADGMVAGQTPFDDVVLLGDALDSQTNEATGYRQFFHEQEAYNRERAAAAAASAAASAMQAQLDEIDERYEGESKDLARTQAREQLARTQARNSANDAITMAGIERDNELSAIRSSALYRRLGEQNEGFGLQMEAFDNAEGDFFRDMSTDADPYRAINASQVGNRSPLAQYAKDVLDLGNESEQVKFDNKEKEIKLNDRVAQNAIWDQIAAEDAAQVAREHQTGLRMLAWGLRHQDGGAALAALENSQDLVDAWNLERQLALATTPPTVSADQNVALPQTPYEPAVTAAVSHADSVLDAIQDSGFFSGPTTTQTKSGGGSPSRKRVSAAPKPQTGSRSSGGLVNALGQKNVKSTALKPPVPKGNKAAAVNKVPVSVTAALAKNVVNKASKSKGKGGVVVGSGGLKKVARPAAVAAPVATSGGYDLGYYEYGGGGYDYSQGYSQGSKSSGGSVQSDSYYEEVYGAHAGSVYEAIQDSGFDFNTTSNKNAGSVGGMYS